jgi:hypothetical protein
MCNWPISTYMSRIITIAETRAGKPWNIVRKALSGRRRGARRSNRPTSCKTRPSPPCHGAPGAEERQPCEDGPKGGWPRRAHLGRGSTPCGAALAHLAHADSIDGEEDGAGVHSGIFPLQPPVPTLYKKEATPPNTHTHTTTHTTLHTSSRELLCNTPGVCHSLSSGFELKHDRLSGGEPNLNLDVTPLLCI